MVGFTAIVGVSPLDPFDPATPCCPWGPVAPAGMPRVRERLDDEYVAVGFAPEESEFTVTEEIGVTESVAQTTRRTLLVNVIAETLSDPEQESLFVSKVIVEPRIPDGMMTVNLVPS